MKMKRLLTLTTSTFLVVAADELAPHEKWAEVIREKVAASKAENIQLSQQDNFIAIIAEYIRNMSAVEFPEDLEAQFDYFADKMDTDSSQGNLRSALGANNNNERFQIPIPLQAIWGYGCWCHFGDDLMKGQGQPVNQMDQFCKDMQQCLRCAVMDGEECLMDDSLGDSSGPSEPKVCDPTNQSYESQFSKLPEEQSILSDCAGANPDSLCAKNTCCCEMKFISDLLSLITSFVPFDPSYQHARGWDYEANCTPNPPNPGPAPERACCGAYPSRSVYNSKNMECCLEDNQVYSPLSHQCCLDGVGVKQAGNCL